MLFLYLLTCKERKKDNKKNNYTRLPGIKEAGPQDHDSLTGALLQLGLDGAELAVDDAHHALNLSRSHGPRTGLFSQQVHHMGGELCASLGLGCIRQTVKGGNSQRNALRCIISC